MMMTLFSKGLKLSNLAKYKELIKFVSTSVIRLNSLHNVVMMVKEVKGNKLF